MANETTWGCIAKQNNTPILKSTLPETDMRIKYGAIPGTPYYTITQTEGSILFGTSSYPTVNYLQSSTSTGTALKFSTAQSDLAKWEIHPAGEFKVIEMNYLQQVSDIITRNDQRVDKAVINNDRSEPITYHFSINGSYNETSNFSNTEGVSVSVTETIQVGIPIVEIFTGNISISSTTTSSKSWTFGKSESKSKTIQHTIDVPIPANTRTIVEAYMASYDTSVTYVAVLQDVNSNKIFKVKGKWSGITTTEFYCTVRDETTNQIITTYKIPNQPQDK